MHVLRLLAVLLPGGRIRLAKDMDMNKQFTADELATIVSLHGQADGKRADLRDADLRDANKA